MKLINRNSQHAQNRPNLLINSRTRHWKTFSAFASVIFALTACESYDLGTISELRPTGAPGQYRWETFGDAIYPENSPNAEAARLRQMDIALRRTQQCAAYKIVDREAILRSTGSLNKARVHRIFYTVQC